MPRLMTYNVHRCVGGDRRLDLDRVAAVIGEYAPDVVCLQELDVGRARTDHVDQAAAIAARLGMTLHFHPAMRVESELYGDAILTHHPERLIKTGALPTVSGVPGLEPRGALWVRIEIDGRPLNVITTHLGLVPREQRLQAAALAGREWLQHPEMTGPVILAGDFNATSITRPYRILASRLADAQHRLGRRPTLKTFPSGFPAIRIDHLFISPDIRPTDVATPFSPLARMASDHLPLVLDFEIAPPAGAGLT
jgi:endonuclease/exonuclease/phosphatase family metal-dependent hydrolase